MVSGIGLTLLPSRSGVGEVAYLPPSMKHPGTPFEILFPNALPKKLGARNSKQKTQNQELQDGGLHHLGAPFSTFSRNFPAFSQLLERHLSICASVVTFFTWN